MKIKTVDNKPVKTPEGKFVVVGWFSFVDEQGLPLDVVIQILNDKGFMPDWCNFYDQAVESGWKPKSIYQRLKSAIEDIYGKEFADGWNLKFRKLIIAKILNEKA